MMKAVSDTLYDIISIYCPSNKIVITLILSFCLKTRLHFGLMLITALIQVHAWILYSFITWVPTSAWGWGGTRGLPSPVKAVIVTI